MPCARGGLWFLYRSVSWPNECLHPQGGNSHLTPTLRSKALVRRDQF